MTGQQSPGSPGLISTFVGSGTRHGPSRHRWVITGLVAAAVLLGALLAATMATSAQAQGTFQVRKTIWPMANDCNATATAPRRADPRSV